MTSYVSVTSQLWQNNHYGEIIPEMGYVIDQREIPAIDSDGYIREIVLFDKTTDELKAISERSDDGDKLYTTRVFVDGEEIMMDCAWLSMTAFDMWCEKMDESEDKK